MQKKRKVIGITGGVGSGKSVVMEILKKEFGAGVILADLVAHDLMEPGQSSYEQIKACFGADILSPDGTIDRAALSQVVFGKKEKLEQLNQITHPNVKKEILARIEEMQKMGQVSFVAVEAALLLEEGYENLFEEMWYVYAEEEIRIQRLREGRGYSREKTLSIMRQQQKEAVFRKKCDRIIENNGDVEKTKEQVKEAVFALLMEQSSI